MDGLAPSLLEIIILKRKERLVCAGGGQSVLRTNLVAGSLS